jgi:hypothetical protein
VPTATSSVRTPAQLGEFFDGQHDYNAVTGTTDELKDILIWAADFVRVVAQRCDHVDRIVVASPIYRHTVIVILFSKHALDRVFVDFTRAHFQIVRFLEPVKAIQVHLFKPKTFVIGQSDGDGVLTGRDEFERAVIIIMYSFVCEGFICTAHGDVFAVIVPSATSQVKTYGSEYPTCWLVPTSDRTA